MSGGDHRWFKRSTGKKRLVTRDDNDDDDDGDDGDDDDDDNNNNNNNNNPRKQGGRGLMRLEAAHPVEITKLAEYVDRKEDPLIQNNK